MVGLPFPGLGVVFDIDALDGGNYGSRAWRLFMTHCDPLRIAGGVLVEGDTDATLGGSANEFCIGVYGLGLDFDHVRDAFESSDADGLAPIFRRFIEQIALRQQPLVIRGRVDGSGRLVTDAWSRRDHDLCKEAGWGYAPGAAPDDLDPVLRAELADLAARRSR